MLSSLFNKKGSSHSSMEIQGVIFYALMGDHPQAGPRKLRLGIPGTTTTLDVFRNILCQTHNIDPLKSRLDIQYFASREAVPSSATLRNYDELRVTCTRRQLRDIVEEEERVDAAKRRVQEQEAEQRVFSMLGESTSGGNTYVSTSAAHRSGHTSGTAATSLMRMAAISKLVLPLGLAQQLATSEEGEGDEKSLCTLCQCVLIETDKAITECCRRVCCKSCLAYARSLVSDGQCPVCGSTTPVDLVTQRSQGGAASTVVSAVKREHPSLDAAGAAAFMTRAASAGAGHDGSRHWSAILRSDSDCGMWLQSIGGRIGASLAALSKKALVLTESQGIDHLVRRKKRPRTSDDVLEW
ncbi:Hypothetical protein, putative [Bodo saltans]|uniref:RING-type domain-containing protein n=1 Tax=Bodo saltans TaxID=75058 RepID=A0A0S4J496_BODSA|nr:Hypothetical protein, putative [Bodo saltans]|eukprot:CUG86289.1 Hypothetical protein, putative [Bodo saltans]